MAGSGRTLRETVLESSPILALLNESFISSWSLVKELEELQVRLTPCWGCQGGFLFHQGGICSKPSQSPATAGAEQTADGGRLRSGTVTPLALSWCQV